MAFFTGLRCRECGRAYPAEAIYACEFCFGPLEVDYDYEALGRSLSRESIAAGPRSMWRYRPLLPVESEDVVSLGAGWTPLTPAPRLGRELGLRRLYLKNDTVNLTHSFKDRVVSVALTRARELGFRVVACASTGNLANAVAAHAAQAGLEAYVFIPADLERGKIVASSIYGARLIGVDGSYDDVNRLSSQIAAEFGWAFVNITIRPYYAEGSKTLGYEVAEQLDWQAPDHVVVPVASGSLLTKVHKAFKELHQVGLIEEPQTRISGAQAEGCSPVSKAFKAGTLDVLPVKPDTIAKSLAIGNPADGYYALRSVTETGGFVEDVTDEEIGEGVRLLARTEGIFAETAGGVTVAVLAKLAASGRIEPDETTVALITGTGLKTVEAVEDTCGLSARIAPSLDAFKELVGQERDPSRPPDRPAVVA